MTTCVRKGCGKKAVSMDQCWPHYQSFRRIAIREGYWKPQGRRPHKRRRGRCARCPRKSAVRDLCYGCWARERAERIAQGTWRPSPRERPAGVTSYTYERRCVRYGCRRAARAHDQCATHYKSWLRLQKK